MGNRWIRAGFENVIDPDDVSEKDPVELAAFSCAGEILPVLERVVGCRAIPRVSPHSLLNMADAVHVEGIEPDLLCHLEAPFQQLENGRLHSNEEQSRSGQSDATPKDSARSRNPPDSALQSEPAAEKKRAGKKETKPIIEGAHGWCDLSTMRIAMKNPEEPTGSGGGN